MSYSTCPECGGASMHSQACATGAAYISKQFRAKQKVEYEALKQELLGGQMGQAGPQQQAVGGTQSPTFPKLGVQAKGSGYYYGIQWLADQVARKPQAQPDPAAKLKPTKTYKCKACSTPLNESDAAVNPKTGNIWGCYKCGGKNLEEVGSGTYWREIEAGLVTEKAYFSGWDIATEEAFKAIYPYVPNIKKP